MVAMGHGSDRDHQSDDQKTNERERERYIERARSLIGGGWLQEKYDGQQIG